jgi:hypothetical protein
MHRRRRRISAAIDVINCLSADLQCVCVCCLLTEFVLMLDETRIVKLEWGRLCSLACAACFSRKSGNTYCPVSFISIFCVSSLLSFSSSHPFSSIVDHIYVSFIAAILSRFPMSCLKLLFLPSFLNFRCLTRVQGYDRGK